jgi:hypothetical protein
LLATHLLVAGLAIPFAAPWQKSAMFFWMLPACMGILYGQLALLAAYLPARPTLWSRGLIVLEITGLLWGAITWGWWTTGDSFEVANPAGALGMVVWLSFGWLALVSWLTQAVGGWSIQLADPPGDDPGTSLVSRFRGDRPRVWIILGGLLNLALVWAYERLFWPHDQRPRYASGFSWRELLILGGWMALWGTMVALIVIPWIGILLAPNWRPRRSLAVGGGMTLLLLGLPPVLTTLLGDPTWGRVVAVMFLSANATVIVTLLTLRTLGDRLGSHHGATAAGATPRPLSPRP